MFKSKVIEHRRRVPNSLAIGRRQVSLAAAAPLGLLALLLASFLAAAGPRPALSQAAVALIRVDIQTVAKGYRTSALTGSGVVNDKNEKIGTIDDIIIGQDKKVLFAVLQVGGFLKLGGHLVAVPFDILELDDTGKKIVLPGATVDELKALPEFKYRT